MYLYLPKHKKEILYANHNSTEIIQRVMLFVLKPTPVYLETRMQICDQHLNFYFMILPHSFTYEWTGFVQRTQSKIRYFKNYFFYVRTESIVSQSWGEGTVMQKLESSPIKKEDRATNQSKELAKISEKTILSFPKLMLEFMNVF